MPATITTDLTQIFNGDSSANWALNINTPTNPDLIEVQSNRKEGTGSVGFFVLNAVLNGAHENITATDLTNTHIFVWTSLVGMTVDTLANGGFRIYVDDGTNWGEWFVGGSDTYTGGFQMFVVDTTRPFDSSSATTPDLTAITGAGFAFLVTVVPAPDTPGGLIDVMRFGSGITVTGGTVSVPITFQDIHDADTTGGSPPQYGVIQKHFSEGVFVFTGRLTIGDDGGTLLTVFEDSNQVIMVAELPASTGHFNLEFGSNTTNPTQVVLGNEIGSGVGATGVAGNTFSDVGDVSFKVEATDADISKLHLFGTVIINSVALRDDSLQNYKVEDNSLGTFTDDTEDANDAGANDAPYFPASAAVDDASYFGHNDKFNQLKINTGTAGVGTYTVAWEYSTSTGFSALTDVTDGTSNFKTTGLQTVSYAVPDDWAKRTVDGDNRFWIRAKVDSGTMTTNPLGTQFFCVMGGRLEFEDADLKAISCIFTNCDAIRVRSGAILRKCTITDSISSAKEGAVDLGSADPATDTFREMQIQNCNRGILLKGTSTGTTTYNFRDIKFAGNTTDVRVDFPSAATITINILEGGDTPTIDNVNGSTVNIVADPVSLTVNVDDHLGANLQNARVLAEASDGTGDFPFEESVTITRTGGTATVTHTSHGLATADIVVIRGADQPEYNGSHTITVTDVNTYTYTVSGSPATPATGTINSTQAWLSGLTDINGQITASYTISVDQNIEGFIRKSSSGTTRYKSFNLAGNVVDSVNGLIITVRMILDE